MDEVGLILENLKTSRLEEKWFAAASWKEPKTASDKELRQGLKTVQKAKHDHVRNLRTQGIGYVKHDALMSSQHPAAKEYQRLHHAEMEHHAEFARRGIHEGSSSTEGSF